MGSQTLPCRERRVSGHKKRARGQSLPRNVWGKVVNRQVRADLQVRAFRTVLASAWRCLSPAAPGLVLSARTCVQTLPARRRFGGWAAQGGAALSAGLSNSSSGQSALCAKAAETDERCRSHEK